MGTINAGSTGVRAARIVVAAGVAFGAAAVFTGNSRPDPLPGFPRLVLWAWERPERMPFLDPRAAGVAFLARTIRWHDGVVESRPRLQPLTVPAETRLMAVVRLESAGGPLPDAEIVAREASRATQLSGVRALQVDFDARLSDGSGTGICWLTSENRCRPAYRWASQPSRCGARATTGWAACP